jgi:hypothetical protein
LDDQFAVQNGCQPPKRWHSKWPQGLDLLLKAFRHAKAQQILKFFVDLIDENGNTFEQKLLFNLGIDTIEPKNIEAVLSTQFTGS